MTPRTRWILRGIALAALAGLAVSSLSLVHHYGREQTAYCDLGASFNCDIVNRSIYSSVLGDSGGADRNAWLPGDVGPRHRLSQPT